MASVPTSSRVRLGKTELLVSPICFGTWQLAERWWGKIDEQQVIDAIHRAPDVGVNFFDTADAYGDGHSEEVLGRALAGMRRDDLVIATKAFWHFHPGSDRRYPDLSRDYLLMECEASLRRLKLNHIDLYQCHSFDPLTPPEEIVEAMEMLKRGGKIRAYGTSNWSVEQMRLGDSIAGANFGSNQPMYNLLRRGIEADVLPYCQANDIGTLVYSSIHLGLLSGKYTGTETFTDVRKDQPDFQGDRFRTIADRVRQVGEIARGYNLTTVQLVLAATLMHPGITSAIVGIKRPEQIEDAAGALGKTISREDWYKVRGLLSV